MARYWLKADCPRKAYKIRTSEKRGLPKPLTVRRLKTSPDAKQPASVEVPKEILTKLEATFVGPYLVKDKTGDESKTKDPDPKK